MWPAFECDERKRVMHATARCSSAVASIFASNTVSTSRFETCLEIFESKIRISDLETGESLRIPSLSDFAFTIAHVCPPDQDHWLRIVCHRSSIPAVFEITILAPSARSAFCLRSGVIRRFSLD